MDTFSKVIPVDATGFAGILGPTDTTVQKAFNTLDGLTIAPTTGSYITWQADAGLTNSKVLTGTAGQISVTDATIALVATSVTPGSYTLSSITVDAYGRITAASSGSAGADLSGQPFVTWTAASGLTNEKVLAGTAGRIALTDATFDLATTAVTPGSYTLSSITVDAYGRITAASNGSAGADVTGEPFVTWQATTGLSNEKVLAGTAGRVTVTNAVIDLATTAVAAGSYTYATLTVDAYGRLTAASSGTTPALANASFITTTSEAGLSNESVLSNGTATTVDLTTPGQAKVNLNNTAVTPGSYTHASITVDQQGRLTAASSGTVPADMSAYPFVTWQATTGLSNEKVLAGTAGRVTVTNAVIDLATTAVSAGSYTNASLTVDAYGRLTAASSGAAPLTGYTNSYDTALGVGTSGSGTAPYSTLIGYGAGGAGITSESSVLVGYMAGYYPTGDDNVAVGSAALYGNSAAKSAYGNVAVGGSAMYSATLAAHCTCVGSGAGSGITSGALNTCIGYRAGRVLATISNSTFVGSDAGYNSTSADSVAVGHEALYNPYGLYNVAIGAGCLYGNASTRTAANCVAIGRAAGASVSSCAESVFVGNSAGQAVTSGASNVAVGHDSLYTVTTQAGNVAVGHSAAKGVASPNNVAIGVNALYTKGCTGTVAIGVNALYALDWYSLSTESLVENNTAVGSYAGDALRATYDRSSAARNTILGYSALGAAYCNTDGVTCDDNTAVGAYAAGRLAAGANNNTAVGAYSLYASASGVDYNTAIGCKALYAATGDYNTAVGNEAGYYHTSSSGNTFVGAGAGKGPSTATGSYNSAVGNNALSGITSGTYNVAIGYSAGVTGAPGTSATLATGTQNVMIGYQASTSATNDSYAVVVGPDCVASSRSVCIGVSNECTQASPGTTTPSVCIGYNTTASGNRSVRIGHSGSATGESSIAIGDAANATATDAIQLGTGSNSTATTLRVGAGNVSGAYLCYATTWVSYSDVRFKEEVLDLPLGLSLINSLRPVSYKLKGSSDYQDTRGRKRMGLIAQEVKETMVALTGQPHSAYIEDDEGGWAVDYNQFVAPLIKAVQELSSKVDSLSAELAELKGHHGS